MGHYGTIVLDIEKAAYRLGFTSWILTVFCADGSTHEFIANDFDLRYDLKRSSGLRTFYFRRGLFGRRILMAAAPFNPINTD